MLIQVETKSLLRAFFVVVIIGLASYGAYTLLFPKPQIGQVAMSSLPPASAPTTGGGVNLPPPPPASPAGMPGVSSQDQTPPPSTTSKDAPSYFSFDGSTGLHTQKNFTQYGASAITVEFWIRGNPPASDALCILEEIDDGYSASMEVAQNVQGAGPGLIDFSLHLDQDHYGLAPAIPTTALLDGTWHHFASTYDGSFMRTYLDGVEQGVPIAASEKIQTSHPAPLSIGYRETSDIGKVMADMADIRIYNVARSAKEIAADSEGASVSLADPTLTGYWPLNGSLLDLSSNGNDLISTGPGNQEGVTGRVIDY